MAIQNRRGPYKNLDTAKLLPGEYAVVLRDDPFCTDGKAVYICFVAGDTKRMATYEDMQENIASITQALRDNLAENIEEVIAVARDTIDKTQAIGDDLKAKKENGDFNGLQGANGIVTVTQGQVAFQILDGELYVYYHDGDSAPDCRIDENGCLIMNFGGTE